MKLVEKDCEVLGTKVWIRVVAWENEVEGAERVVEDAFAWARAFEQKYSRFVEGNFLANLNERVGEWVEVDEELYGLLKFAGELKKQTRGAFDISVKGILENWGYDKNYSFVEKEGSGVLAEIELAADFQRHGALASKIEGGKKMVKISGQIELGGLGKGYAVDKMAEKLRAFSGFFINAGGDIFTKGSNENGDKWKVYFEHPCDPEQVIGFVNAENLALACTSPSKRKWGNKHHLVDPKTKQPANKMAAIYTQAGSCLMADAWATALFVLGYEEAREMIEKQVKSMPRPSVGLEAMIVDVSGEIFRTEGFQGELFS